MEDMEPTKTVSKRSPEGSNRNSLRSLHLLEEAFLTLVMKTPVDKITVSDITREACLNRGTFYAHFASMSDLEKYVLEHLADRFIDFASNWYDISFLKNPRPMLVQLGSFVQMHRKLITSITRSTSFNPFMVALEQSIEKRLYESIEKTYADREPHRLALIVITVDYVVHGILSSYSSWIQGEYGTLSLEQVNDALERLIKATGLTLLDEDMG